VNDLRLVARAASAARRRLALPLKRFAATTVIAVAAVFVITSWTAAAGQSELDQGLYAVAPGELTVSQLGSQSTAEAKRTIAETARRHHVDLSLAVPDIDGTIGVWDLYTFAGDRGGSRANGEFPMRLFDASTRIHTHPAAAIDTEDLRGRYLVSASSPKLQAVVADLTRSGLTVQAMTIPAWALPFVALQDGGTGLVVLVSALGAILALWSEALRRQRRQGVRRISGWSRRETVLREARDISLLIGGVILATTVAGAVALFFYNGFIGVGRLLPQLAALWALAALLIVLFHLAFMAWPRVQKIPRIFAGAAPSRLASTVPVVIHTAVVFVAVSGLVSATSALDAAKSLEQTLEHQARYSRSVRVSLGVAWAFDSSLDESFGAVVRSEMRAGNAVMAQHNAANDPNYAYGPDGSQTMTVNRAYLQHETLLAPDGRKLNLPGDSSGRLDLLLPLSLRPEKERILAEYREWLAYQQESGAEAARTTMRVQYIADRQVTPDLGDDDDPHLPARSDNVIAVLPDDAALASSAFLTEAAGNGQVLFSDPAGLRAALDNAGLSGFVSSYTRYGDNVNRQLVEVRGEAERLSVASVLALAVLMFATISMVGHHAARRRSQRRVLTLTGRSAWAAHGSFLALSAATTIVVAVFAVATTAAPATTLTAVAALCVLVDIATRVVGLGILSRADARALRESSPRPRNGRRSYPRQRRRH
jgi:hypothetical protein